MIYPQEHNAAQKDALRHATSYYAGECWSMCPGTMPALLENLQRQGDLGQGHFPLLSDARRGIYQTTLQWLRGPAAAWSAWSSGIWYCCSRALVVSNSLPLLVFWAVSRSMHWNSGR